MVKSNDVPSVAQHLKLGKYRSSDVNGNKDEFYNLLRDTQGSPQVYVEDDDLRIMIDSLDFLQDSLFCEWAYIINLDTEELEIYKGFVKEPPKESRYYDPDFELDGDSYYPVELVKKVPFVECRHFDMEKLEDEIYDDED